MEHSTRTYLSVILPLKLDWTPCYEAGGTEAFAGARVKVEFSGKVYSGVVERTGVVPDIDPSRIKPVLGIEEGLEPVSLEEIRLWRQVADYYMCSVGEVYKAAYPALKISQEEASARKKARLEAARERRVVLLQERIGRTRVRLGKKEEKVADVQRRLSEGRKVKEGLLGSLVGDREKISSELAGLEAELELAEAASGAEQERTWSDHLLDKAREITLSDRQQTAFQEILDAFGEHKPVLLNGITGSGKTEIYIRLAAQTLAAGRNVLYLVPEIALSRQLEYRIRKVFGPLLHTFHSGESMASRRDTANLLRECAGNGNRYIVLGTRSSLFLPHHGLGLIVVDEEHDSSYKQDSPAPRYNGRDTAMMLAGIHGCDILLGSATPSMESLFNSVYGKYRMVRLDKRYHDSEDAGIEIIDTKAERRKRGMVGSFSRILIRNIEETLAKGEQVMILRARRSFSPALQCDSCGFIPKCPHCNVSLSLHLRPDRLVCHYCGFSKPYDPKCPECGNELKGMGTGTQKIEEEARALFPQARIARMDSDTNQSQRYGMETIKAFSEGRTDILIGTQIVTKGFDFPGLTLVAAIAADSLLGLQDFRADEKAVQTLEQLRGRCGRRDRKGKFLIQTSQPDHPVYRKLEGQETGMDFLNERKDFGFPPFTRMVNLLLKDTEPSRLETLSWSLAADLRKALEDIRDTPLSPTVTGPYAPLVDKIGDRHIRIIRINLRKDRRLSEHKQTVLEVIRRFQDRYRYADHIAIDVDPN